MNKENNNLNNSENPTESNADFVYDFNFSNQVNSRTPQPVQSEKKEVTSPEQSESFLIAVNESNAPTAPVLKPQVNEDEGLKFINPPTIEEMSAPLPVESPVFNPTPVIPLGALMSEPKPPEPIENPYLPKENINQLQGKNGIFLFVILIGIAVVLAFPSLTKILNKNKPKPEPVPLEQKEKVEIPVELSAEEILKKIVAPQNFLYKASVEISGTTSKEWLNSRFSYSLAQSDKYRSRSILNIHGHNKLLGEAETYMIAENDVVKTYVKGTVTNNKWSKIDTPYKTLDIKDFEEYKDENNHYLLDNGKLERRKNATINGKTVYVLKIILSYKNYNQFKTGIIDPITITPLIKFRIDNSKPVISTIYIDSNTFYVLKVHTDYNSCVTKMDFNTPGYTNVTVNGFSQTEEFEEFGNVKKITAPQ